MTTPEEPSILDAVAPQRHHVAADDEPVREPHPEFGDVTDADTECAVSDDPRPDLGDGEAAGAAKSPAEDLYDDSPASNANDDTSEEIEALEANGGL